MKIDELWKQAEESGLPVDIGNVVVCDFCALDFTERKDSGGLIFCGRGCCPICEPRLTPLIKLHGETDLIEARCAFDRSFAEFVIEYRGSNTTIRITKNLSSLVR